VCGQQVHAPTCPIVTLRNEVLELLSHLGIFVSNIRDTVDTIDRILTDRE
jgi:hypothetical protein